MMRGMGLIDSHAHLTYAGLYERIGEVMAGCTDAGVDAVITVATNTAEASKALALAGDHPSRVYVAAGVHPHEAEKVTDAEFAVIEQVWDDPRVVALGEMGLDYHYDFADRGVQRVVFARQLALAASRRKPLVIHSREALDDTVALLRDHGYENRPVVFHCFTGSAEEAARIAEHGWVISFTGVVTFKKSTALQEVARDYPVDKLMVETDAPYLSPEPVRGQRPCEPAFVAHTARFLATLRGVSNEELVAQTERNTRGFFGLRV